MIYPETPKLSLLSSPDVCQEQSHNFTFLTSGHSTIHSLASLVCQVQLRGQDTPTTWWRNWRPVRSMCHHFSITWLDPTVSSFPSVYLMVYLLSSHCNSSIQGFLSKSEWVIWLFEIIGLTLVNYCALALIQAYRNSSRIQVMYNISKLPFWYHISSGYWLNSMLSPSGQQKLNLFNLSLFALKEIDLRNQFKWIQNINI